MDEQISEQLKDQFNDLIPPALGSRVSEFQQLNLKYSYSGISNASSSNDFLLTTTRSFNEDYTVKFTFIESKQLFNTIKTWAEQLQKRMMIHSQLIIYLLYMYRWNEEKLNDVYYDKLVDEYSILNQKLLNKIQNCPTQEQQDKQKIEQKTQQGSCEVCYKQGIPLYNNFFCAHSFCQDCWRSFVKQNLTNNKIFFSCMDLQCKHYPVLPQFVSLIIPQLFQLYKKKICINYAIVNKSISYCPSDQCQFFCQKPLIAQQNYVQCPCGRTYCFKCEKQPHQPASCLEVQKWTKITNQQKNNQLWIQKYTRKCPTCKQPVQKYVGCNKVKCMCGSEFCFSCHSLWDQKHKSLTQCHLAKEKLSNNSQNKQQSSIGPLTDKIIYICRSINQDMTIIKHTLEILSKQQSLHYLKDLFQDIKLKIHHAWTNIKWSMVALFLRQKPAIQVEIEKDSIGSIQSLMETVSKIEKKISNYDHFSFSHFLIIQSKDLLHLKEELFKRKQTLNKTMQVWTQAFRSIIDYS